MAHLGVGMTGIKEYHVYLTGRPFAVFTDHLSLKYLQSLEVSANNRLARRSLALEPYNFEINYKESKKLTAADGLNRRPFPHLPDMKGDELTDDSFITQIDSDDFDKETRGKITDKRHQRRRMLAATRQADDVENHKDECSEDDDSEINDEVLEGYDMQKLERECPDFKPIFQYIEDGVLPDVEAAARKLVMETDSFVIDDGILYLFVIHEQKGCMRLCY